MVLSVCPSQKPVGPGAFEKMNGILVEKSNNFQEKLNYWTPHGALVIRN